MSHRARAYHNIESLARITHARRARRRWKLHLEKHEIKTIQKLRSASKEFIEKYPWTY